MGQESCQLRSSHGSNQALTGEAPPKRYRMGEVVQHTGLSRQTLHNYTRWGLIREVDWTRGGHRLFDASVFQRLAMVVALKPTHSIAQIGHLLPSEQNNSGAV